MFEKATRMKLRWESPRGLLSVEELWDLPLTSTSPQRPSLQEVARSVAKLIKSEGEEDFVGNTSVADTILTLKLEVVKHIIAVKKAEGEARAKAVARAEQKRKILELIEEKQSAELAAKPLAELEAMLQEL